MGYARSEKRYLNLARPSILVSKGIFFYYISLIGYRMFGHLSFFLIARIFGFDARQTAHPATRRTRRLKLSIQKKVSRNEPRISPFSPKYRRRSDALSFHNYPMPSLNQAFLHLHAKKNLLCPAHLVSAPLFSFKTLNASDPQQTASHSSAR